MKCILVLILLILSSNSFLDYNFSSPLFHVVSQTRAEEVISVLRGLPAASIMYQEGGRDSSL